MDFSEIVLPEDVQKASKLYDCMIECLKRTYHHEDITGDMDKAEYWKAEAERCREELQRLTKARVEQNQVSALIKSLNKRGIKVKAVKSCHRLNEQQPSIVVSV
ncbi:hypothetical protein LC040_12325 [Bacillus tianshenii]|nr:hypothetical protein LC040_12325 [Bacillus tianshenii]